MAAELEAGLGLTGLDIRCIDEQLAGKTLTPDLEQQCLQHRAYGSELKTRSLQSLGDTPSAADEVEQYNLKRAEIEERVDAELTRIRQQNPGLDEAWTVWCEREKLMQIREDMLSHPHPQACMVQTVPPEYGQLTPMDPSAGKLRVASLPKINRPTFNVLLLQPFFLQRWLRLPLQRSLASLHIMSGRGHGSLLEYIWNPLAWLKGYGYMFAQ
jgi:hypothetical protein